MSRHRFVLAVLMVFCLGTSGVAQASIPVETDTSFTDVSGLFVDIRTDGIIQSPHWGPTTYPQALELPFRVCAQTTVSVVMAGDGWMATLWLEETARSHLDTTLTSIIDRNSTLDSPKRITLVLRPGHYRARATVGNAMLPYTPTTPLSLTLQSTIPESAPIVEVATPMPHQTVGAKLFVDVRPRVISNYESLRFFPAIPPALTLVLLDGREIARYPGAPIGVSVPLIAAEPGEHTVEIRPVDANGRFRPVHRTITVDPARGREETTVVPVLFSVYGTPFPNTTEVRRFLEKGERLNLGIHSFGYPLDCWFRHPDGSRVLAGHTTSSNPLYCGIESAPQTGTYTATIALCTHLLGFRTDSAASVSITTVIGEDRVIAVTPRIVDPSGDGPCVVRFSVPFETPAGLPLTIATTDGVCIARILPVIGDGRTYWWGGYDENGNIPAEGELTCVVTSGDGCEARGVFYILYHISGCGGG